MSTKVGVDQAIFHLDHRSPQGWVSHAFLARPFVELPGLEDTHGSPVFRRKHSTRCHESQW
jgi:hypothetical protein